MYPVRWIKQWFICISENLMHASNFTSKVFQYMNANTFLFTSTFNKTVLNIWNLQNSSDSFDHIKIKLKICPSAVKWKCIHLDPCNFVARVKYGFSEIWQGISLQHISNAIMFNLSQFKKRDTSLLNVNIHCQIHMEFIVPQFFILYTILTISFLSLKKTKKTLVKGYEYLSVSKLLIFFCHINITWQIKQGLLKAF